MAEEKEKPKKSRWWCCLGVIVGIGLLIFLFWFTQLRPTSNQQNSTKPAAARNYQYPQPSSEAANRKIDCYDFVFYSVNKDKKLLCLNLYQTSADNIASALANNTYDRIVLYGQNLVFDADAKLTTPSYPEKLYRTAKFNDLITVPTMMQYYGVSSLDYISKEFAPYPAFYYEIDSVAETANQCRNEASGCALAHFASIVSEEIFNDAKSFGAAYVRQDAGDRIGFQVNWPSDCYSNQTFMHETGHLLAGAKPAKRVGMGLDFISLPDWFNEEQAGFTAKMAPNWVCGPNTSVKDEGNFDSLVQFESVYPPTELSHELSTNNSCELASINEFYRYVSSGDVKQTYANFFQKIRAYTQTNVFNTDQEFANFVLGFNNIPAEKDFLNSHGCGI